MSGLMTAFLGGAANGVFNMTVGNGNSTGPLGSSFYSFWGWSEITGVPAGASIYPATTFGSAPTSYISGIKIRGFYSVDTVTQTLSGTRGDFYYVWVDGDQSANLSLITTLSIGGTNLAYSAESAVYDSGRLVTYFKYTPNSPSIPTLFGTTVGASKDIVIS